jgi:hypothetical protein
MVLDPDLVQKAKDAAARIDNAERDVQAARADYHVLVRRLHLGGASLREIARALEVSHQRVQQIVDAAGGTWWQRVWRTRNARHELVCTFCGEPPRETSKLIAGPDVFVCDRCVDLAQRALTRGRAGALIRSGARAKTTCSFCAKPARVAMTAEASVCAACVGVCRQLLADRT